MPLLFRLLLLGTLLVAPRLRTHLSDDQAILAAIFPAGPPALPYTLYLYHGPLERRLQVVARTTLQAGAGEETMLVAVAVTCRPDSSAYPDAEGRVMLALVERQRGAWHLIAHSALAGNTHFAGTIESGAIAVNSPAAGDLSLSYRYTLSGSGSPSTSYLRIYRRSAATLSDVLDLQTDQHISAGACCELGNAATLSVLHTVGPVSYAVNLVGYARTGKRTDRYLLPGSIRYVQTPAGYRPDRLLATTGGGGYPLARLPVLAALPATGTAMDWLAEPARTYLPGAAPALTAPGSTLTAAQLFAGWSAGGLTLVIRTAAAWPAGAQPRRIDLYLQPYSAPSTSHLAFSPHLAHCEGGQGYGGKGYQCTITIRARQAWGPGIRLEAGATPRGVSPDHRYRVLAATRVAVLLTAATSGGLRSYTLDPATTSRDAGALSTLAILQPLG